MRSTYTAVRTATLVTVLGLIPLGWWASGQTDTGQPLVGAALIVAAHMVRRTTRQQA